MRVRVARRLRVVLACVGVGAAIACVPQAIPEQCVGDPVGGVRNVTSVTGNGESTRPRDLSKAIVRALLPRGTGGFTTCEGSGASDGTFTIPDVPKVLYYLQLGGNFFITRERDLDLSFVTLGRPDAAPPTSVTNLEVKVSNLLPWTNEDGLQLVSMDAGALSIDPNKRATNPPALDAKTIDLTFDWQKEDTNLIRSGDQTFFLQYTSANAIGQTYLSIVRALSTTTFNLTPGLKNLLTGAMSEPPAAQAIPSFTWQRSAFLDAATAANPAVTTDEQVFFVSPEPGGTAHGRFSETPTLLVSRFDNKSAVDLPLSGYQFANPFPPSWTVFGRLTTLFSQQLGIPGSTAAAFQTQVFVEAELHALAEGTVTPLAVPVLDLRVNGQNAFDAQLDVGLSPTVSWKRPTPAPDQVVVFVEHLLDQQGATGDETVAILRTQTENQVTIPEGILMMGQRYYFYVAATAEVGADLAHHPTGIGIPRGSGDVMSAVMTP